MIKMRKTRILIITEMKTVSIRKKFSLSEKKRRIAEIAQHHHDLTHNAADDTGHLRAAHLFIYQRGDERHKSLDDERAGRIVAVAEEEIRQHRADAARRKAVPWAEQPAREQHEAVA